MYLITLVFLSLHSVGDNMCQYQVCTAAPVTSSPTAAPVSGPTTSLAPSRLGSGLYLPNSFTGEGGPAVCIIDVGKYELPSATPMYTSLQDCCM